ncbi:MAG: hypothetical protein NVSMB25_25020 [Thermoleophilaceae bacterium]
MQRNKALTSAICGAAAVMPAVALADQPEPAPPVSEASTGAGIVSVSVRIEAARELSAAHAGRRAARRRRPARWSRSTAAVPAALVRIAACESGGDPAAADGAHRGKYQFDYQTWASVGGRGDPAQASSAEQDRRATMLYRREGTAPWPACGRGL